MSEEAEIVNLDDCPKKPALLAGGAIAFLLTLFPMTYLLCCMPLILAGFVATTTFIFKYKVRLDLKVGMRVAILACLIGFGLSTIVYDLLWAFFDYRIGFELYISLLEKLVEAAPSGSGDQLEESIELLREQTIGFAEALQQLFALFIASGIGGAIGGALATSFFKKGVPAQ